jgi:hypothetical protein
MNLPDFLVYESANARHCIASVLMFSKLDMLELLDLENELSSLSD